MTTNVSDTSEIFYDVYSDTSEIFYDVYSDTSEIFYDALDTFEKTKTNIHTTLASKLRDQYTQRTHRWLNEKFPDFCKVNFNDTTCLLTGKPQAGKSGFCFGVALMHLLLGKPVILIVRNFTQDAEHMKAKLIRFAKEHTKQMNKYAPKGINRTIGVVDAVQMSLVKDKENDIFSVTGYEEIKEALKGKNMNMIIALANGSQLKCINMVLDKLEEEGANNPNLVMLTDEADAVAYSEIKEPSPLKHKAAEYVILQERCKQTYEISATVWDILRGNQDLTNTNIIYIRPPTSYKGIRDGVQFIELAHKIEKWDSNKTLFDEDPNLIQVYEELIETPIFSPKRYNCKIEHPVIVIHKTRNLIKHHKTFYELFRTSSMYCNIWTVMMECDKGLYLYSNVLKNKTIKIGKIKFSDTKETGEFLFGKRIIIPQLMQWFIDNGGAKKFSHIVIKSGDFSSRSRSYISTDGNWHLTHQYYGGGSSVPDMIQAQRLLHDRPDSIPLIEYAPSKVIDNIVKGDIMQDEQIERLIDLRITGNVEILTHIQVAEEIWNKEKIPKASLCCGNVNKSFKIQKENCVEGEDGGWAVKKYNEILANIETMVNVMIADSDDEKHEKEEDEKDTPMVESVAKELPEDEFIRLTTEMFPKWAKADTKIARFMQNLDPRKVYTEKEMKEIHKEYGIINISDLINKGLSHGHGLLMKKTNNNYQLYPELVSSFEKYF